MKINKEKIKKFSSLIFIISFASFIFGFIFYKFEVFSYILFLIFFITLVVGIIMRLIALGDAGEQFLRLKKKKKTKWVFEGSAGWLAFWLLIIPPLGWLWLVLSMEKKRNTQSSTH